MRRAIAFGLGFAFLLGGGGAGQAGPRPERAPMCPVGLIALVLSGGGAKGMAHVGVIRVLDSLGFRPDIVVGTSIGALVGALYASGYSGRQIDSLARVLPLARLFQGFYVDLPRPLAEWPPWAVLDQGQNGFHLRLPAPRAREVNELLNEVLLRGNLEARGSFDALSVPLRVVATDLKNGKPVVIAGGDLAQAVRASMALPLVLTPQVLGGRTLVDGGLSAKVPVQEARAAGAIRVIVSDVTDGLPESTDPESLMWWVVRLWDLVNVQTPDSLRMGDVSVRPAVKTFPDLGFPPGVVSQLIRLGELAADSALSKSECPLPVVADPPGSLPERLERVTISGGSDADARFIQTLFPSAGENRISMASIRAALDRLASTGRYEEVWINPSGSPESLVLDIRVRPVSRRLLAVGFALHSDVGVRMWLSAMDRRLASDAVTASGELLVGKLRQEVRLAVRYSGGKPDEALLALSASFAHERQRIFDSSGEVLGGRDTREVAAFLGPERSLGDDWFAAFGVEGRLWHEPALGNGAAAGFGARVTRGGATSATSLRADASLTAAYQRVEMQAHGSATAGRFRFMPRVRVGWGRSLPLQSTFMLGGADGFPGLHIGERRGDREVSVRVGASYSVAGPLRAHVELAVGRTATGGAVIPRGRWPVGGRVGMGIDTPVGPIRVEYGRATDHRGMVTARVGTWF